MENQQEASQMPDTERLDKMETELWNKLSEIQSTVVEIQTAMATLIAKTENYPKRMHDLEKRQSSQEIEIAGMRPILKATVWVSGLTLTVLSGGIAAYVVSHL